MLSSQQRERTQAIEALMEECFNKQIKGIVVMFVVKSQLQ